MSPAISATRCSSLSAARSVRVAISTRMNGRATSAEGPALRDPSRSSLLWQYVQVLNAAVQDIDWMHDPQVPDVRNFHVDGAADEIFRRQTDDSRQKIDLFHAAVFQTVSHFARLRCRVVETGDPRVPAETFPQALRKSGVADKVGIGRDFRNEICRTLDLQVIGPESQRLTADEKTAGRANAEDHLHLLGCQGFLNSAPILHRTRAADGSSARREPAQAGSCASRPTARHAQADPPRQGSR